MGSNTSFPAEGIRRISLPPLTCVCCKSTYIDQTDGEDNEDTDEPLGELGDDSGDRPEGALNLSSA